MVWWAGLLLCAGLLEAANNQPLTGRVWTDEGGRTVAEDVWLGNPVLMTTFYQGCSMMCPRTLAKLRRAEAAFRQRGQPLELVLITLDPGADTVDQLMAFKRREHLSSHWHLLHGPKAQVSSFCRDYFGWIPMYDGEHVTHGTGFLLLDPRGHLLRTCRGWSFDEAALPRALEEEPKPPR